MVSLYKNVLAEQAIETTHIKKKIKENGKKTNKEDIIIIHSVQIILKI